MVLILPSFNELAKDRGVVYQSNVSYEPIYNKVYDIIPKKIDDRVDKETNVGIFDLTLVMILKNIANSILLFLLDLIRPSTYTSFDNFSNIFFKENRLMYLGIFVIILAIFILIFTK